MTKTIRNVVSWLETLLGLLAGGPAAAQVAAPAWQSAVAAAAGAVMVQASTLKRAGYLVGALPAAGQASQVASTLSETGRRARRNFRV